MSVRRNSRKLKRESESVQGDLLAQVHPLCPHCKGDGRHLVTIRGGHSTQTDWALLKFNAQAFDTWTVLEEKEPHFVAFIEKRIAKGQWRDGDRYYERCGVCNGSGHITPECAHLIWRWMVWRYHHGFCLHRDSFAALKVSADFSAKADKLEAAYEKRAREEARIRATAQKLLSERF
jgi:hypothetical protein